MKPDVQNASSKVETRKSWLQDILAEVNEDDTPYWCGYWDGFYGYSMNSSPMNESDKFSHAVGSEYWQGWNDGSGDLEILSE